MSIATAHLAALSRAELTLLARNRTNLFTVVLSPVLITLGMKPTLDRLDLAGAGLDMGPVMISTAVGIVLTMGVYTALTAVYAARREELLLKRLRSGELSDVEILCGSAVPMVATALVQCVILAAGITVVGDVAAPAAPHLAVLGILLGVVLMAVAAAVSSAPASSAESAQVVVLPGLIVFLFTSGALVPLEILPDPVAAVCRRLPLSPAIALVRSGWTGGASWGESVLHVVTALAWIGLALFAVKRWFRWEPRS